MLFFASSMFRPSRCIIFFIGMISPRLKLSSPLNHIWAFHALPLKCSNLIGFSTSNSIQWVLSCTPKLSMYFPLYSNRIWFLFQQGWSSNNSIGLVNIPIKANVSHINRVNTPQPPRCMLGMTSLMSLISLSNLTINSFSISTNIRKLNQISMRFVSEYSVNS